MFFQLKHNVVIRLVAYINFQLNEAFYGNLQTRSNHVTYHIVFNEGQEEVIIQMYLLFCPSYSREEYRCISAAKAWGKISNSRMREKNVK